MGYFVGRSTKACTFSYKMAIDDHERCFVSTAGAVGGRFMRELVPSLYFL